MDGAGEWATGSMGTGRDNRIELTHETHFPHSIGLLYSAFTYFTGFRVNSGEYKLMGLAPYGEPVYRDLILDKLLDLKEDGSFRMDMRYFNYCQGVTMTNSRFASLFNGPPRKPESPLTQREMDIAASIQSVTEEIVLRMVRHTASVTGMKNLVMAGGVALNCVANGKALRDGAFENIWIQPAAGDAGGALGAALFVWHQLLGNGREVDGVHDLQSGSLLGPEFANDEIRAFLDNECAVYDFLEDEGKLLETLVDQLTSEKVVGHMAGRMEFGPRALGSRSILGDARSTRMQSVMNLKIKFRESFRPFAPSCMRQHVQDWFEMRPQEDSPYMLLVAPVRQDRRKEGAEAEGLKGIDRLLKVVRSDVPAITHVDCSARVQTVDPVRHGRYYRLLERFYEKTGTPLVINTSFNIRGEPIVCTPADAYRCFMATNMDVLVMENFLLFKDRQPKAEQHEIDEYLAKFDLD
jgi:carbamoyltransferase